MKRVILILALASSAVLAQGVPNSNNLGDITLPVIRNQLGTGTPAPTITVGVENARYVDDGYYHVPQDMPYYPTAAVIWPRVVELECEKIHGNLVCEGYHWLPKLGRGEYLFVVPKLKEVAKTVIVHTPPPPPIVIYKEVPVKKKPE
jgi:hypothetical protein